MRSKNVQIVSQEQGLPTEKFSSWLRRTQRAQKTKAEIRVPCGDCKACCTSSYFIHIGPDETDTLAKIPQEFLFAAPGLPQGHVVLGYDKNGHCPLFINNECSIYNDRPRTCRNYDCRIFTATGLSSDKPLIDRQAERWRFAFRTIQDREHFLALQAAAKFLREHAEFFPAGFFPHNSTQQASVALKVYKVFLTSMQKAEDGEYADYENEMVQAIIAAYGDES